MSMSIKLTIRLCQTGGNFKKELRNTARVCVYSTASVALRAIQYNEIKIDHNQVCRINILYIYIAVFDMYLKTECVGVVNTYCLWYIG